MRPYLAVIVRPNPRSVDEKERLHINIAFAKPDPCGAIFYRPDLLVKNLIAPKGKGILGRLEREFYRLRQIAKRY